MYMTVTRGLLVVHWVASKYVPWDIMVTNWIICIMVKLDFHQMRSDLPVSGTRVCMQMK